jgi:hypothetical protein
MFSKTPFLFDPYNVGTITGTAEAYYGWLVR